jgi:DNA-binding LytR/AlgR family response regulator
MILNCLAIDDEPLALNLIHKFVQKIPYLKLIETYESAFDAVEILKKQAIDLIFLDVNMPDINGIQFIKSLATPPMLIITTAHAKYALDGYELNAVDYLLKPFAFERFLKAVDKAYGLKLLKTPQNLPETEEKLAQTAELNTKPNFIFVKSEHQFVKIDLADIIYIESLKDYLKIHLESQKTPIITLSTLKSFADQLNPQEFIRVHRSYVVAMSKIKSIRKSRLVAGQTEIPIGEMYVDNLFKKVGLSES